jgi:hypothetical protein
VDRYVSWTDVRHGRVRGGTRGPGRETRPSLFALMTLVRGACREYSSSPPYVSEACCPVHRDSVERTGGQRARRFHLKRQRVQGRRPKSEGSRGKGVHGRRVGKSGALGRVEGYKGLAQSAAARTRPEQRPGEGRTRATRERALMCPIDEPVVFNTNASFACL